MLQTFSVLNAVCSVSFLGLFRIQTNSFVLTFLLPLRVLPAADCVSVQQLASMIQTVHRPSRRSSWAHCQLQGRFSQPTPVSFCQNPSEQDGGSNWEGEEAALRVEEVRWQPPSGNGGWKRETELNWSCSWHEKGPNYLWIFWFWEEQNKHLSWCAKKRKNANLDEKPNGEKNSGKRKKCKKKSGRVSLISNAKKRHRFQTQGKRRWAEICESEEMHFIR